MEMTETVQKSLCFAKANKWREIPEGKGRTEQMW